MTVISRRLTTVVVGFGVSLNVGVTACGPTVYDFPETITGSIRLSGVQSTSERDRDTIVDITVVTSYPWVSVTVSVTGSKP